MSLIIWSIYLKAVIPIINAINKLITYNISIFKLNKTNASALIKICSKITSLYINAFEVNNIKKAMKIKMLPKILYTAGSRCLNNMLITAVEVNNMKEDKERMDCNDK